MYTIYMLNIGVISKRIFSAYGDRHQSSRHQSDNVVIHVNHLYKLFGNNRLRKLTKFNKYCCSNEMSKLGFKDVVFKYVAND